MSQAKLLDIHRAMTIGAQGNFINYVSNTSVRRATWMHAGAYLSFLVLPVATASSLSAPRVRCSLSCAADWTVSTSMSLKPGQINYIQTWQIPLSDGTFAYVANRPNGSYVQYNPNTFFAAPRDHSAAPSVVSLSGAVSIDDGYVDKLFEQEGMRHDEWARRQRQMRTIPRGERRPDLMGMDALHQGLETASVAESERFETRPSFREATSAERALLLDQVVSISSSWGETSMVYGSSPESGLVSAANADKIGIPGAALLGQVRDPIVAPDPENARRMLDPAENHTRRTSRASLFAASASSASSAQIRLAQAAPVQSGPPVNLTYFVSRPVFDLLAVAFVTPKYGVAVGLVGQMMYTKTGGVSWEYTFSPTLFDLFAIDSLTCMTMSTIKVPASTQVAPLTLAGTCAASL